MWLVLCGCVQHTLIHINMYLYACEYVARVCGYFICTVLRATKRYTYKVIYVRVYTILQIPCRETRTSQTASLPYLYQFVITDQCQDSFTMISTWHLASVNSSSSDNAFKTYYALQMQAASSVINGQDEKMLTVEEIFKRKTAKSTQKLSKTQNKLFQDLNDVPIQLL